MKQIKQFDPPPNPAKITDPRAKGYIAEHGDKSWEVDALNPETLHEIIDTNINKLLDLDLFNAKIAQEVLEKAEIAKLPEQRSSLIDIQNHLIARISTLAPAKDDMPEIHAVYNELIKIQNLIK